MISRKTYTFYLMLSLIPLTTSYFFYIIHSRESDSRMTISQKIKMALAYKGISEATLARSIDSTPAAFNQRLKTGKFTSEELETIGIALGAKYYFGFSFPDGTQI